MTAGAKIPDNESLDSYVQGWRERCSREAEAAADWRERMRVRIEAVVKMLVRDYGVTRAILFGSFARGEAVPGSDVDLLISGLEPGRLIDATVAAERILTDAYVDLVPVQLARPTVRARAEQEGVRIHGR